MWVAFAFALFANVQAIFFFFAENPLYMHGDVIATRIEPLQIAVKWISSNARFDYIGQW